MKALVLGLLLAAGCAQGVPLVETGESTMSSSSVGGYADDCSRVFSPTAEAEPYARQAVERWSEATGCDISIGPGGYPIEMVDEVHDNEGNVALGSTTVDGTCDLDRIEIWRGSASPYATTTHEVGHALSDNCRTDIFQHSASGIMAPRLKSASIDMASLEVICSGLPCQIMAPNEQPDR